jgi:hypothetical protein
VVLEINPADGLIAPLEKTIVLGVAKFARFCTLKHSALNSALNRSVSVVVLNRERSTSASPGPRKLPRLTSPPVPAVGSVNAFGSNHCACRPGMTGPVKSGLREGRSGLRVSPLPDRFEPV